MLFYRFQDADTPAVMPDHLVAPDWPSYRQGRDYVMDWLDGEGRRLAARSAAPYRSVRFLPRR